MQRIPDFSSARKETVDILVTSRNQPSKFTSAVGNCQGFCRGKQCLHSNHLGKNITEVIISSKLYIQLTIFNTSFSINFVYKQQISLAHTREVSVCATKSQIYYILLAVYSSPFSSFAWQWNKFAFSSYIIESMKFYDVTFLNNFYFVSFFYHLFICWRQRKTCDIKGALMQI